MTLYSVKVELVGSGRTRHGRDRRDRTGGRMGGPGSNGGVGLAGQGQMGDLDCRLGSDGGVRLAGRLGQGG